MHHVTPQTALKPCKPCGLTCVRQRQERRVRQQPRAAPSALPQAPGSACEPAKAAARARTPSNLCRNGTMCMIKEQ